VLLTHSLHEQGESARQNFGSARRWPVVENINIACAAGYPVSVGTAAFTAVHQVKTIAFKRNRVMATGVTVPQIADLPSVLSAKTSELRT
jgi:hypothetical protein